MTTAYITGVRVGSDLRGRSCTPSSAPMTSDTLDVELELVEAEMDQVLGELELLANNVSNGGCAAANGGCAAANCASGAANNGASGAANNGASGAANGGAACEEPFVLKKILTCARILQGLVVRYDQVHAALRRRVAQWRRAGPQHRASWLTTRLHDSLNQPTPTKLLVQNAHIPANWSAQTGCGDYLPASLQLPNAVSELVAAAGTVAKRRSSVQAGSKAKVQVRLQDTPRIERSSTRQQDRQSDSAAPTFRGRHKAHRGTWPTQKNEQERGHHKVKQKVKQKAKETQKNVGSILNKTSKALSSTKTPNLIKSKVTRSTGSVRRSVYQPKLSSFQPLAATQATQSETARRYDTARQYETATTRKTPYPHKIKTKSSSTLIWKPPQTSKTTRLRWGSAR